MGLKILWSRQAKTLSRHPGHKAQTLRRVGAALQLQGGAGQKQGVRLEFLGVRFHAHRFQKIHQLFAHFKHRVGRLQYPHEFPRNLRTGLQVIHSLSEICARGRNWNHWIGFDVIGVEGHARMGSPQHFHSIFHLAGGVARGYLKKKKQKKNGFSFSKIGEKLKIFKKRKKRFVVPTTAICSWCHGLKISPRLPHGPRYLPTPSLVPTHRFVPNVHLGNEKEKGERRKEQRTQWKQKEKQPCLVDSVVM